MKAVELHTWRYNLNRQGRLIARYNGYDGLCTPSKLADTIREMDSLISQHSTIARITMNGYVGRVCIELDLDVRAKRILIEEGLVDESPQ